MIPFKGLRRQAACAGGWAGRLRRPPTGRGRKTCRVAGAVQSYADRADGG
jgi:hypothetical protein